MKLIEAKILFSKIDFQDNIHYKTYPKSIYKCPVCKYKLSFCMQDFEKYSFNKKSLFLIIEQEKFMRTVKLSKIKEPNSFIDYYCPKCNVPTRIYFTTWAGGRYTSGYHVEFIIINTDM